MEQIPAMTTKAAAEELKRSVGILDLLTRYGIESQRRGNKHKALCPFHEDHNPSLSVDPVENVWHCFGCGKGGSSIDFVMQKEGIDFKAAVDRLRLETGDLDRLPSPEAPPRKKPEDPPPPTLTPEERRQVADVIEYYHRTLSGEDSRGLDYLKRRHIADPETLKAFKVGYCNGTLRKVLPDTAKATLKRIGLLRPDGREAFDGCIVIPVFTESGDLGECFARFIVDRKTTNHLYLPGAHRGVLNAKAAEVYEEIILTEAAFDALTLYAHGLKNVVPCYGTGGFTPEHRALLHKTRRVYIAFDNDEAGEEGAKRLASSLDGAGIECHRVHVPKDLGKDINEYVTALYRSGMKAEEIATALKDLVAKAPRFGFHREKSTKLTLSESGNPDDLVFTNCEIKYRFRGLYDNSGTSLRVILTARRDDAVHTDRLDLYTAKHRVSFAYRAASRLEIPAAKIEEDLSRLIPLLETLVAEGKGKEEGVANKVPEMTEAEKREALALLRTPELLHRVAADLEIIGYVGEEKNKQLVYLIATSRKLDKPLSAIIRSESGAGKSFLMECIAELMPPEDVKFYSRLTPQSLYYMGRDELVHKLLIVDERDGSEEAEYSIRTLQTRRKLSLALPVKDPTTGKSKTLVLEILGPISYLESTTATSINPENSNRNFEVYLDESDEQTRRVYAAQKKAHTLAGWLGEEERAAAIRRHRNAQRLLRPLRVLIPYTEAISFPESWTRGRRDNERMLYLIEAIAFLHQHQRPVKSDPVKGEYIEATVEDYAAAYALARAALSQALCDVPRLARTVLSHLRVMVREWSQRLGIAEKDYGFRQRDVREFTKLPHHVIKRAMKSLEELELVHTRGGGRGHTPVYVLAAGEKTADPLAGLTTPEELKRRWKP